MKLIEIFNQLTYGELSQLNIGGVANGEITEDNYKPVVAHINLGLTALYKRFSLKEGRLVLGLQPGQTIYTLHSKFAVNGKRTAEPVRYIKDTLAAPFLDDIHKIERVLTDAGYELGLNNGADPYSCATSSALVLHIPLIMVNGSSDIPDLLKTSQLTVAYRANHVLIDADAGTFNPDMLDIELPYSHLMALLLFVASRVNNPIGMTNEFNAGNNYAAKYEQECQRLELDGLEIDQGSQNTRARRNGWV